MNGAAKEVEKRFAPLFPQEIVETWLNQLDRVKFPTEYGGAVSL